LPAFEARGALEILIAAAARVEFFARQGKVWTSKRICIEKSGGKLLLINYAAPRFALMKNLFHQRPVCWFFFCQERVNKKELFDV